MWRSSRRLPIRRGLALLLIFAISGCGTLTVDEERQLGREAQRQVAEQYTLMRDRVVVNYVRELGRELVDGARPTPFDLRFYVVESDDLNAFAIPGGAIYVNTGLIGKVTNASELVGVLAHEIGHVTARHSAKMARRNRNTGIVAQVAAIAIAILTGSQIAAQAGQFGAGLAAQAYTATHTREAEREADALAVETMVGAGWDPDGMVSMFQILIEDSRGGFKPPQFLLSHPAPQERVDFVRAEIQRVGGGESLRKDDGGRLAIIQKRIELIIGTDPADDP